MEKRIKSYNASYPAAFYEIGTVYSLYGSMSSSGTPATQEYISRYSSVLKGLEAQQKSNAIQPVKGSSAKATGGKGGLTRYYAVVVSKSATNIEVMFLNDDNGIESYLTRKYTVGKSCATDGKDLMAPSIKTNVTGVQGGTQRTGGITRAQKNGGQGKVGGITKAGQTSTASANIGGITRMKKQSTGDVCFPGTTNQAALKVGGITRMKKQSTGDVSDSTTTNQAAPRVGGITRMKR